MIYVIVVWVTIALITLLLWANNAGRSKNKTYGRKGGKDDIVAEFKRILRKMKIVVKL